MDETALSNWEVLKANDYGRFNAGPCLVPDGPCGFAAWDRAARAVAIAPTLAVFRDARMTFHASWSFKPRQPNETD